MSIGKFLLVRGLSTLKGKALETWDTVKNELKELVEKIETGVEKIEGFASRTMERLRDFVTFGDEMHSFAKDIGQEEAVETDYAFDGAGFDIPERAEAFSILNAIKAKSWKAARSIDEWLMKLEPHRLKEVVKSGILGDISGLEGKVLDDVGEAWRLNKDADDFYKLLKGVGTALELRSEERMEKIFTLLNGFVETRDEDMVAFLEKTLGWMTEDREAFEKGDNRRTWIVDKVTELAEASKFKLDGTRMLRVSGILENLLETHGGRDAYSLFVEYLHAHLLDYAGLGGEKVEPSLLEECLSKWEIASRTKDSHVSLLRSSVSQGSIRYEANTPREMNYIRVDKDGEEAYIPVIATRIPDRESYIVGVPHDAQEYLKSIGYLLKDTGLILFTETKPGNAKTIIPVTVEEGGKIALTEWLERFFHKDAEYREKYLLETEDGYELNFKQLDHDCMVLIVTATKDEEACIRRVLLKPQKQGVLRIRVGEIANPKDIIICEFEMVSWKGKILSVGEAEDIYKNQYGIEDETLANSLARNTNGAMLLSKEEGLTVTDTQIKEHFGYWMAFQILWDYGLFEDFQLEVRVGETSITADFKAVLKRLIEVKNLDPDTVYWSKWQEDLKSELTRYRKAVEAGKAKETVLFLCNPFDERKISYLNSKLNEWFDDLRWLKICNGEEEIEEYVKLLARILAES
ncbi:MAG: hypothetical protein QXZ36_00305 [Thermoproteota archaeon]